MKKGVLSTILVIQLILLVLLTFSKLQAERESFSIEYQYQRLSSYRIAAAFEDISYDVYYLKKMNSTSQTIEDYISFVNNTFKEKFLLDIELNSSYLVIKDRNLELQKEGKI
ncbi:MAG: hypothetical protein J7K22_02420 [Nanoarchaeota archaeon]|nr:hypothetical protein [Nanoarchaeota archaeon]